MKKTTLEISKMTVKELILYSYEQIIEELKNSNIKEARKYIRFLLESLDMKEPISNNLYEIYVFIDKELAKKEISIEPKFENEIKHVNQLIEAFENVEDVQIVRDEVSAAETDENNTYKKGTEFKA